MVTMMIYHFSSLDGIAEVAAKCTVNIIKTGSKLIIPLLPLTYSTSSTNSGAAAIDDTNDDTAITSNHNNHITPNPTLITI